MPKDFTYEARLNNQLRPMVGPHVQIGVLCERGRPLPKERPK